MEIATSEFKTSSASRATSLMTAHNSFGLICIAASACSNTPLSYIYNDFPASVGIKLGGQN